MAFRGDDRAQTVQVGAVLLFATIIIALSLYQATVVPQENQQVEFAAYQEASADMLDLRNALLSTASGDGARAVTFKTGARYPSRTFLMNGLDPAGTVSTTAAANVTLGNVDANATAFENVGAYVANESHELNYTSRRVRFDPAYNHISPASLVTTNGFVYRTHDNATQLAPQTLVRGNTITLTTIVGTLDASGYNTPITAVAVSAHVNTVTVTNQSAGPLNLTLPTQLNASEWNETVLGTTGTQLVQDVTDGPRPDTVTVQLEANEQYELKIARVELRERDDDDEFTDPDARYLVAETDRETAVNDDGRVKLVVEARDALNNPRSNWPVTFNTSGGQLETRDGTALGSQRTVRSNEEGDAILWFDKAGSGDATVRATLGTETTGGAEETVEWTVSDAAAGGGGGGGDTTGPEVTSASASPSPVAQGGTVSVSATVSDIGRGGLDIQSAEWFHANASESVSAADPGTGNANPMSFVTREYYAVEDFEATGIDTTNWESGDNTVAVRGLDTNGNWGPLVTRTVTVVDSNPLITAVQPNPSTLSDANGEFIQVRIPKSLNTSGWTLLEQDASWTIPSDVNGTHYFVRNENEFTNQWGVDSANVTQWNGLVLDNGGQTIELEDDTGTLLDRFSYGNGDGQQFANSSPYDFSANGGQAGQVAYRRTDASGSYIDTDAASDWNQTGESAYFNPPSVSAVTLGNDGSDNVAFSFDSSQSLSEITVTVDGPSTTDVYTFTRGDFTESESGGTYTYTLDTTQAYDDGTGTYTATVDDAVNAAGKNGGENGQGSGLSDSYTYTAGGGFAASSVTSVTPNANSQGQTIRFTLGSDIAGSETIDIDLSDAQATGPDQIDYQSASVTLVSGPSGSSPGFSTQSADNAVVTWYAPSGGATAGETVVLRITSVAVGASGDQSNPYSGTFTRSDGGSATTQFSAAYDSGTPEISSVSATNITVGSGKTQNVSFTLATDLADGERVTVDLSDAQDTTGTFVNYQNANSATVVEGTGSVGLTANSDSSWLTYTAGTGDTAGDTVKVEISGQNADVATQGDATQFTVGYSRWDADTVSGSFTVLDPSAIQFNNVQNFVADANSDEFRIGDVQIQDSDNDDDLSRVEYVITNSSGAVVATRTDSASDPAEYRVQNFLINDSVPVQQGETYTLEVTAYDADGNYDSQTTTSSAPSISMRVDDVTSQGDDAPRFITSYEVSNTVGSFQRVEVEYSDQTAGTSSTRQNSAERGSIDYQPGSGAGNTYDITVKVIYNGPSGEYTAASQTFSGVVANAENPAANADLGTGSSPVLGSSSFTDKSKTTGNNQDVEYRASYTVQQTSSFSSIEFVAVSRSGSGSRASKTSGSTSQSGWKLNIGSGTNTEHKVTLLVYDNDGVVVDTYTVVDVADKDDP